MSASFTELYDVTRLSRMGLVQLCAILALAYCSTLFTECDTKSLHVFTD